MNSNVQENLQYASLDYSFNVNMFSNPHGLNEDLVTEINGVVFYDDDGLSRREVGSVRWVRLETAIALDRGECLFDALDSNPDWEPYIDLLDLDNGCLSEKVVDQFGIDNEMAGILIGDRIHIHEEFRGNKLAGRLVDDAARRFVDMALIVIKPFPLQLEKRRIAEAELRTEVEDKTTFNEEPDIAIRKLREYYERLGFEEIPDTDLMGMPNKYHC